MTKEEATKSPNVNKMLQRIMNLINIKWMMMVIFMLITSKCITTRRDGGILFLICSFHMQMNPGSARSSAMVQGTKWYGRVRQICGTWKFGPPPPPRTIVLWSDEMKIQNIDNQTQSIFPILWLWFCHIEALNSWDGYWNLGRQEDRYWNLGTGRQGQ